MVNLPVRWRALRQRRRRRSAGPLSTSRRDTGRHDGYPNHEHEE